MKRRKPAKMGCAFALAAAVSLMGLGIVRTQAAGGVETDRDCSLTVSVEIGRGAGSNEEYLEDLNEMQIPVSVYRVADVDATGQKFTPTEPFSGLEPGRVIGEPGTEAAGWQELAEEAAAILEQKTQEEQLLCEAGNTVAAREEGSGQAAVGRIQGLKPGLYLVVPKDTCNAAYTVRYTFAPYLTALPSSEYTLTGTGSDAWVYDTDVGLKPDAEPLYGKLSITKHLQNYNATLGRTTFVFSIVGRDQNHVIRYEEVESLSFTDPGSQTITLEKIPAGLTVTVTEIYSGASYQVEGDREKTVLICSQEGVALGGAEQGQTEAAVAFTNRYDGGNRGGYGVTNHFESDGAGGWIWENPTTPAGE